MKLTKIDQIPGRMSYSATKLQALLEEFLDSKAEFMEVVFSDKEYKSVRSCYGGIRVAAKRFGYPVVVLTREGRCFLRRKSPEELALLPSKSKPSPTTNFYIPPAPKKRGPYKKRGEKEATANEAKK